MQLQQDGMASFLYSGVKYDVVFLIPVFILLMRDRNWNSKKSFKKKQRFGKWTEAVLRSVCYIGTVIMPLCVI